MEFLSDGRPLDTSLRAPETLAKRRLHFVLGLSVTAAAFLVACSLDRDQNRGIEILSRTVITGSVNASPFEGQVSATFNTRRGGSSSCEFSKLPTGFTPATVNTHA
ncbi:MAG TPA: hypothetical protein VLJ18_07395 [Thermoanaerobaculia bacterium]|nr:hypothetical protein [Thermoanaerobaculia bacterium]